MAFKKGHKPWNKGRKNLTKEEHSMWGKKHTEASKEKMKKAKKGKMPKVSIGDIMKDKDPWNKGTRGICKSNSGSFKKGSVPWSKDRRFSEKHRKKLSGKNNYNWKGGISPLSKRIRMSLKYRQWRSDVFTRDDFTCQECGKRGDSIVAHHIKKFSDIFKDNNIKTLKQAWTCEEFWNLNNGKTLCEKCHDKIPKK